jgi:hypothetical protein
MNATRHAAAIGLALMLAAAGAGALERPDAAAPLRPDREEARLLPTGDDWQRRGSGNTSFLGLRLYRATLWTAGRADDPAAAVRLPHALTLRYARDFSRDTLVEASLREMKRLGAGEGELARWKADLARVFPDVKAGEVITGVHRPGHGALFLHEGRLTGEVADAEFARRFFGIWLDPRSRDPDLRARLLDPAPAAGATP